MSGFLSRLLFPTACPLCGCLDKGALVDSQGCCDACYNTYVYPRERAGITAPAFVKGCGQVYCCSFYGEQMREAMGRFKFSGETYMGACFGRIIHSILKDTDVYDNTDIITTVPVSPKRFKERGYNQSLLIAGEVAGLSGLPLKETLIRSTQGAAQSTLLWEERQAADHNKFTVNKEAAESLKGRSLLLVDDILTTGSTLSQCCSVLLETGVRWITAVCVTGGRKDFL